jgi:hypothetical protein
MSTNPQGPSQLDIPSTHSASPTYPPIPAFGTLIQVRTGVGPPEMYQTIAGVGDITGPANSLGEVETTSHSTGVPIRSYVPALIDLGDLTFPCFWNPSDPTQNVNSPFGIEFLFYNRQITKFQLVMPDPTHRTRQFMGYVKTMGEDYKVQGVCTKNIAIRINSVLTDVPSAIAVTPASASVPGTGTTAPQTVQLTAGGSAAPWLPIASAPWITVVTPTAPQTGDGPFTYSVAAQTVGATARTGTIVVASLSLTFTINQANG